jgi:sec-independent protein translocase protein TatC
VTTATEPEQKPPEEQATVEGGRMTISEHIEELRTRLVRSLLGVGAGFLLAMWRIEDVVGFMRRPLDAVMSKYTDVSLIQTKAYLAFTGSLKVAFFTGLVCASPVILYQIWAFVGAGLYSHERRTIKFYAVPGFFLFLGGVTIAYVFVLPWALDFLVGWSADLGVSSMFEFSAYISLVAFGMFIFGMVFQLPVVMVFLMRVGVVEPATFKRYRRHAIVANFTLAMILTPPDVVSQIVLATCMTILYESAILIGSTIAKPRTQS